MLAQDPPQDRIKIGQLRAAYGLQGWLWVYSETDPMANLFDYQPWWFETAQGWSTLTVRRWRTQGKGIVVRLNEVEDRTAAERMQGTDVYISKAQLPKPAEDEYYWSDLKGVLVYGVAEDADGVAAARPLLGAIFELFETGANDVIVVRPCAGSVDQAERLIPWHSSTVQSIDMAARRMEVNWGVDY